MDWIKDFFLEANPNPDRIDCPDEGTLRALAEGRLPVSHSTRLHLASCSDCFAEFRGFKGDWEHTCKKRARIVGLAIAACLLMTTAIVLQIFLQHQRGSRDRGEVAALPSAKARVDLFNSGTVRGGSDETNVLSRVSLPAAMVELSIVLPRFSESGKYEILVSRTRSGSDVVAEGWAGAIDHEGKVAVNVTLDLRRAKPGPYFLATLRSSDGGMYYYPVQIASEVK